MRIISGTYRGKRIIAPKRLPVRPTTDMAKESLFNILNNHYYFEEISVLDLFSGTGNISYEFASRGTKHLIAVDASAHCTSFITKTAQALNFPIKVKKMDGFKYLEKTTGRFDIIFADPPYHFDPTTFAKISESVFKCDLSNEGGTLIIEHADRMALDHLDYFQSKRKYGSSVFSFFENNQ